MAFEPVIAQKGPYVRQENGGIRRSWCSCGLSMSQPFCDGNHSLQETEMRPLHITLPRNGEFSWCGCKRTGTPPFCDGTHEML